jgi:hypothetical protein
VSEVNHPFPNEYASEGIPILAAYAALQDWDGVFWYTFEPKLARDWAPYIGDPYDISLDPVKMPQLAAGALMFIRGDISPARKVIKRSYTAQQVHDSLRLPQSESPYFTTGFPLSLPLRHGSRISSLSGKANGKIDLRDADPIASDTGELVWHISSPERGGLVTVDGERSQAEIGFLGAHNKPLRHLAPEIENRFGSLILTSLDSQPIARSTRMLLTAGAAAGNSGMEWNESRTALKRWGSSPTIVEPVTGHVVIRNIDKARSVTVAALDGCGQRVGSPVLAVKTVDGWKFRLGGNVTTWYEIVVDR